MTGVEPTPNKTIYVTDADQPLFERAQELAGGNLSAAIAQALRRYVADADQSSGDITVVVTENGVSAKKRFQGRLLAQQTVETPDETRTVTYRVYLTRRERYAVWSRGAPNWARQDWKRWRDRQTWTRGWWQADSRLDVYETLEDLRDNVPDELYQRVARISSTGSDVEVLDI